MAKRGKQSRKPAGLSPGTLIYIGNHADHASALMRIRYSADGAHTSAPDQIDCSKLRDSETHSWYQMTGLNDVQAVKTIGDCLGLHPLQMEDIVNTGHRTKVELSDTLLFTILKHGSRTAEGLRMEHVVVVLTEDTVVSFTEHNADIFEPVRKRMLAPPSRMHSRGTDYLFYALLDCIVDYHVELIEDLDDEIITLEETLLEEPGQQVLRRIHQLRRDTLTLRKALLPLRDMMLELHRSESGLLTAETRVFLRDVSDHIVHLLDTLEYDRDVLGALIDLSMSMESNRMNEVMKVLTMIATIFIPLTFISGIYGMNFRTMPELNYPWGYPVTLLLMAAIAAVLILYFRKKRWL
ncbi:MAG: magnesium/cobalt transporter CorA [Bacteroidia bacterium]|nr:magnesium/cobalt transporter CorA [Bacteroidia bacterium]